MTRSDLPTVQLMPGAAPYAASGRLCLEGLGISFGGLRAVDEFRLDLPPTGLHGLIGPNGAGKTTVFNLLTGVYRPDAGTMHLDGRSLRGLAPHRIAAAGVARTFQNIRLFGDLSVLDNVRLACQLRQPLGIVHTLLRTRKFRLVEGDVRRRALELLALFDLQALANEPADSLSYGHQRRLEIARALATRPAVLLLDEPAAGMNTQEKQALSGLIRRIRDEFRVSILLIDHDMALVMGLCEHITVLDYGKIIAAGPPAQIQADHKVIAAYLGTPD